MPNWKKIILSGSTAALSNLDVDNAVTASNLNITSTGSFDRVEANTIDLDKLSLTSTQTTVPPLRLTANSLQDGVGALRIDGSQADIFLNPSTATHTTVTFAVNNDQRLAFGMDNASDFYITRRTGGSWYDDTLVLDRDTGKLSLGYGLGVTGAVTASAFIGDGSALTNISAQVTEQATVTDTFTSVTSKAITHNFGTKNVLVSVFNSSDELIMPASTVTTNTNVVTITFDAATTGRAVVAKGGHLVSGSAVLSGTGVFSGSAQIDAVTRYEESITGASSYTVTHNLGEDYPIVQVYDTNKFQTIPGIISASDANSVYIEFDSSFSGKVVIKK